jgi:glyoxylase-like metal-dependent hydrolase (beta-lactamase superfamily II)
MAENVSGLDYAFETPSFDTPVEVLPGLIWLRLRLPFALDHVNVWIADEGDGWTVIDTGVGNEATRQLWESLLDGLLAGRPISRVIATHFHPDHLGQVGWLCERVGAPLVMTRTEWLMARSLALDDTSGFAAAGERLDRLAGLEEEWVRQRVQRGNLYRRGVSEPPPSFERVRAGDRLTLAGSEWRVLVGEGHAPEQITLYSAERNVLIAADQVLPRISPVIGVWAQIPDANPLEDFLRSLRQYHELPGDCFVLPSHGRPFRGLPFRLAQLVEHHQERLQRVIELCSEPSTAARVMRGLFARELTLQDIGFAQAETLAHLNLLVHRAELGRWVAPDGAWRFEHLRR